MRLTNTSNGTSTDTYVSVKEDESLSLNSYGEINTSYKRKKDKVKPVNRQHKCKSTVFYRTPAPIIVYYFPYITCLLNLLFLIKHVRTSG